MTPQEPCCVPLNLTGEKCCSREVIKGTRPAAFVAVLPATVADVQRDTNPRSPPPTYDAACAKGCCGTGTVAADNAIKIVPAATKKVDTCCTGPATAASVAKKGKGDGCCSEKPTKKVDACCSGNPVKEIDACCSDSKAKPADKVDACCSSSEGHGTPGSCGSETEVSDPPAETLIEEGEGDGCSCCK